MNYVSSYLSSLRYTHIMKNSLIICLFSLVVFICMPLSKVHIRVLIHFNSRLLDWLQTLQIAYVKATQSICQEHFEPKYISSTGRLLKNAVPIPTGKGSWSWYILQHYCTFTPNDQGLCYNWQSLFLYFLKNVSRNCGC